jgi:hypothetical protein
VSYQTINPFTEELVKTFPEHSDAEMQAILTQAGETFRKHWSQWSLADSAPHEGARRETATEPPATVVLNGLRTNSSALTALGASAMRAAATVIRI